MNQIQKMILNNRNLKSITIPNLDKEDKEDKEDKDHKKINVSKLLNQVHKTEVKKKKVLFYCWMSFIVVLIVVSYRY